MLVFVLGLARGIPEVVRSAIQELAYHVLIFLALLKRLESAGGIRRRAYYKAVGIFVPVGLVARIQIRVTRHVGALERIFG